MNDETAVYEIDVNKKYILQFDGELSMDQAERISKQIDTWLKSSHPFLLLDEKVKLVKVNQVELANE